MAGKRSGGYYHQWDPVFGSSAPQQFSAATKKSSMPHARNLVGKQINIEGHKNHPYWVIGTTEQGDNIECLDIDQSDPSWANAFCGDYQCLGADKIRYVWPPSNRPIFDVNDKNEVPIPHPVGLTGYRNVGSVNDPEQDTNEIQVLGVNGNWALLRFIDEDKPVRPGWNIDFRKLDLDNCYFLTEAFYWQARDKTFWWWKEKVLVGDKLVPTKKPKVKEPEVTKQLENDVLLNMITDKLKSELSKEISPKLEEMFAKEIKKKRIKTIRVVTPENKKGKNIDFAHKQFQTLLRIIAQRLPAFMVGPAGSGKTYAAFQASKALDLDFSGISVGPQTTQSHLMGYMNANGKYVETEFRKRFEHGGVFLIDELDAGSAQVLTCLNSALSGQNCAFPDKMVDKHKDFVCVATGNTYGLGANRVYVGRTQLDGATLDRFVYLEWQYDNDMEVAISGADTSWLSRVRSVRSKAEKLGLRHIVSPRASIFGQKLLDSGLKMKEVEELVLFRGLSADDRKRLAG